MRGVVLVVFGGLLIWLGMWTSNPDGEGESDEVDVGRVGDRLSLEGPEEAPQPVKRVKEAWEPDTADDLEADAAPVVADREQPDDPPAQPVSTTRTKPEPTVVLDEEDDDTPVFELGSPSGNPTQLASTLLDAWLAQDPSELQSYLNEGEGSGMSADRRALVGSFWQAMVGRPADARERLEQLAGADGVTSAQVELLRVAAREAADRPAPAGAGRRDALARAMQMILLDDHAARAADLGNHPEAAETYSDLIQAELAAPWAPHRSALLAWADALFLSQTWHRLHKDGAWPSVEHVVQPNESPELVRKRVLERNSKIRVCTGLIERVNGITKYIHPGDVLRIPTDTPNMLVDLDARLAVYRHGTEAVLAWEVGIGKEGHPTPIGTFYVGEKQANPPWFRPGEAPLPYGHPENPLGERWIAWFQDGKKTSYGFHGTNEPDGVGGEVSRGCIRMHNDHVVELYELLPVGSAVIVQP